MAMEQGRVTEFEGKSLDQIQIEPEGRAVEILSQTDGLKETSSGEPSTIHPDAPHGSGSAPSERLRALQKSHSDTPGSDLFSLFVDRSGEVLERSWRGPGECRSHFLSSSAGCFYPQTGPTKAPHEPRPLTLSPAPHEPQPLTEPQTPASQSPPLTEPQPLTEPRPLLLSPIHPMSPPLTEPRPHRAPPQSHRAPPLRAPPLTGPPRPLMSPGPSLSPGPQPPHRAPAPH
uniref:Uncharacterized protein n=1 Tax=Knipowitschia caucasica TaxID=637954 RepID=A0AAV2IUI5_KNICA